MGRPKKHDDAVVRAASKQTVLSLIRLSNETHARVQSESGSLGEQIKNAVDNKHLHAQALKQVAKETRMEEVKRNTLLRAVDLYRDYAREAGMFGDEHVGDLVEDAQALGDVVEDNVSRLRDGIKQAEAAE